MNNTTPSHAQLNAFNSGRSIVSSELGCGDAWLDVIEPLIYASLKALTEELGHPSPVHRKDSQLLDNKIRLARNEAISSALARNDSEELARLRTIVTSSLKPEEMATSVRKACSVHRVIGERIVRVSSELFNAVYSTYYGTRD